MTRNKEAAYASAVEHAFRGKPADIKRLKNVSYAPTDPVFQRCAAEVMQALKGLKKTDTVDLDTFAFMVGVGPSALSKRDDLPEPHSRITRDVPSLGGKKRPSSMRLWTIQQVEIYLKDRIEGDESRKDQQSSAAVSRQRRRTEQKQNIVNLLAQLQKAMAKATKTRALPDWMRTTKIACEVIVAMNGQILGFVDLHNLSPEELRDAFSAGARVERLTLREALIERTWVNVAALRPWAREYRQLMETYASGERELLAASVARSEAEDLKSLPDAAPTARKGLRL